jgi:hypothetical protein
MREEVVVGRKRDWMGWKRELSGARNSLTGKSEELRSRDPEVKFTRCQVSRPGVSRKDGTLHRPKPRNPKESQHSSTDTVTPLRSK